MDSGSKSFLKCLYMGDKASKMRKNIMRAIDREAPFPDLYLITLASNGVDQLDIISARYLADERISSSLPPIAGLAVGRAEAFETVRRMAEDTWKNTGGADIAAYLKSREAEE